MVIVAVVFVLPLVLALGVAGPILVLVAVREHGQHGRWGWPRALLVSSVNALLTGALAAIPAAFIAAGIPDENAGEAMLVLMSMAGGAGAVVGFGLSLPLTLIPSTLLRRRRERAGDPEPPRQGAFSASLAACAVSLTVLACLLVVTGCLVEGFRGGLMASPALLPGMLLALAAILGRRWVAGGLALALSLLPALLVGAYALWDLPEARTAQHHQARVVDKGVPQDQSLLQPYPVDHEAGHHGLILAYDDCDEQVGARISPRKRGGLPDEPSPELARCLDRYAVGDTLDVAFEIRTKRFSGAFIQYDVVQVGDCPIPKAQNQTVPALTHCPVRW